MKRLLLLFALTGCATTGAQLLEPGAGERCDAGKAQNFIGKAATSETAEAARKAAGAEVVRWLRPGMAVTMEYRMGRLNITINEKNVIARINCG